MLRIVQTAHSAWHNCAIRLGTIVPIPQPRVSADKQKRQAPLRLAPAKNSTRVEFLFRGGLTLVHCAIEKNARNCAGRVH